MPQQGNRSQRLKGMPGSSLQCCHVALEIHPKVSHQWQYHCKLRGRVPRHHPELSTSIDVFPLVKNNYWSPQVSEVGVSWLS
jgi:hypothetical protein